jgi:molybdopterin molybdotransferase
MVSLEEALQKIIAARAPWVAESVPLDQALGRVLAEDIIADRDYPPFNRATMDGYAVKSDDILGNRAPEYRVLGEIFAGDGTSFTLRSGEAVKIMTGAPVPDSADAVIRTEEADEHAGVVTFRSAGFKRLQNIARRGEDSKKGALVLTEHLRINFGHLSLLAAVGKNEVRVIRRPRVAIISTGNEIQPVTGTVAVHQIRDSNCWAITGFLRQYSIEPVKTMLVRDTLEDLTKEIGSVMDCDIVIVSGGVSAGDADLVPRALMQCGVEEGFHRVRIKPGKPLWFGQRPDGARVFALPGNPFSVQTACRIFLDPYIRACFHLHANRPLQLPLHTARKKRTELDEFFPAALTGDGMTHVDPLLYNTSGDITAMAGSDGIAHHPADAGDLKEGDIVQLYLWKT